MNFFYKEGNGDKTHAKHYIPNWKIEKKFVGIKKAYLQMNTHLSHLSYTRVNGKFEIYPIDELYNHYIELTINF